MRKYYVLRIEMVLMRPREGGRNYYERFGFVKNENIVSAGV